MINFYELEKSKINQSRVNLNYNQVKEEESLK